MNTNTETQAPPMPYTPISVGNPLKRMTDMAVNKRGQVMLDLRGTQCGLRPLPVPSDPTGLYNTTYEARISMPWAEEDEYVLLVEDIDTVLKATALLTHGRSEMTCETIAYAMLEALVFYFATTVDLTLEDQRTAGTQWVTFYLKLDFGLSSWPECEIKINMYELYRLAMAQRPSETAPC